MRAIGLCRRQCGARVMGITGRESYGRPELKFTAVIPLYNKAGEIHRALTSVLCQQPAPDEVIVVDDGSTDGGDAVAHGIQDPRVRLVRQRNRGEGAARNRGALLARHSLVAFCDADDEWLPGFTEAILRLAQRFPECDVYATGYLIRERGGRDIHPRHSAVPTVEGIIPDYFRTASRSDTPLTSSSVAVRRTSLLAVGGFPENVLVGADFLC